MEATFLASSDVVIGCFVLAGIGEGTKTLSSASSTIIIFLLVKLISVIVINFWSPCGS